MSLSTSRPELTQVDKSLPTLLFYERYEAQKDLILATLDLPAFRDAVLSWLGSRTAMFVNNANMRLIAGHAVKEVDEVKMALEHPDWEGEDPHLEMIDVWWLLFGYTIVKQVEVDDDWVRSRVNGRGRGTHVPENLQDMILNLSAEPGAKDLQYVLVAWLEMFAGLPNVPEVNGLVGQTLVKNNRNYPEEVFDDAQFFAQHPATEAQRRLWYEHPRRCLRSIRDFHLFVLGQADRSKGMPESDWQPYLNFIRAYLDPRIKETELDRHAADQYQLLIKRLFDDHAQQLPSDFWTWRGSLLEYINFHKQQKIAAPDKKPVPEVVLTAGEPITVQTVLLQTAKVA